MPDRQDRPTFRITLAQLNPRVGDLKGNAQLAFEAWEQGRDTGSDLVAMPEMFLTGYQIQDLVMKPAFISAAMEEIETLARRCTEGPALAVGGPWRAEDKLFNAYHILKDGKVAARGSAFNPLFQVSPVTALIFPVAILTANGYSVLCLLRYLDEKFIQRASD